MLRTSTANPWTMAASAMTWALWFGAIGLAEENPSDPPIRNAGFESAALNDWEINRYGAPSKVEFDADIKHVGGRSIRVVATAPSDTALAQEITLKPSSWYRLTGWVRTKELDPHDSPTFGTIQVQHARGRGTIAAGANHHGDTEWAEVVVPFQAPGDGKVRLALFFVGFGRGTGTAWFDDLRLEEVDPSRTPIVVTREPLVPGEISPLQYGQFIEYLCNLVPAMWAEKLHDGSFEGLTPYKLVYLKETDFREHPWHPAGATNRAEYSSDRTTKISGDASQKIAATGDTPCTVGIAQDGLAIQTGVACEFTCYGRSSGAAGPIRVRLHREAAVYATAELHATSEWQKVRAVLVPSSDDANATLTIEFRGPGTLWLDNASLMPGDAIEGWRKDVVEAVRALKPGVIRFGGSALDDANLGEFDWRTTISDPDRRRPFRAWGGLQPTGAGLEEIVRFCRLVGAEPLMCVRTSKKGADDAVAELEYFNGAPDTPMGALRAKNGHPEPYHIRYWQIGNERQGGDYDRQLAIFARAMKAADPKIEFLSSYPTPGVLRAAGSLLDFVCPHHYGCHHLQAMKDDFAAIRKLLHDYAPDRTIKVGVTEWNTTAGDAGPRRAMLWTLSNALACSRYHNLMHRNADLVTIANRSNLINSFCSGIIQTDNHRLYKTPTYYAQQLYATLAGNRPLALKCDWPTDLAPDLSATLTADGAAVVLFAINDTTAALSRPLDLSAFGSTAQEATVWTLADRDRSGEPDVTNNFGDPERIAAVRSTLKAAGPRFALDLPPLSLTVLRWVVEKAAR